MSLCVLIESDSEEEFYSSISGSDQSGSETDTDSG